MTRGTKRTPIEKPVMNARTETAMVAAPTEVRCQRERQKATGATSTSSRPTATNTAGRKRGARRISFTTRAISPTIATAAPRKTGTLWSVELGPTASAWPSMRSGVRWESSRLRLHSTATKANPNRTPASAVGSSSGCRMEKSGAKEGGLVTIRVAQRLRSEFGVS